METQNITVTTDAQSLQHAASKDGSLINLLGVYFNSKHAVATNGHIMAIKVKDAELDTPHNQILKFASPKQKAGKGFTMEIFEPVSNGFVGINGKQSAEKIEGQYPEYMQVIPKVLSEETHYVLSFDVTELQNLAQALDAEAGCKSKIVVLAVPKQENDAIVVLSGNKAKLGIMMPCRTKYTLETVQQRIDSIIKE
jgi:hypothetical protein